MKVKLPKQVADAAQQAVGWAMQEKHIGGVRHLRDDVEKAFTEHPQATGETYWQHLRFTLGMSARFFYTSAAITLHGLFPFLCTRTASNQIEQIYRIMKMRIPVRRREEIDNETRAPIRIVTPRGEARVAIVGGGFSGTMVLANLLRQARGNLTIDWFDPSPPGFGIAYGTGDNTHLLNVRAGRMGAFAGQPEDFVRWLETEEGRREAEAICPGAPLGEDRFLPRALYGRYLQSILQRSLAQAKEKGIQLRLHQSSVVDASLHSAESQQLLLSIDRGGLQQELLTDALVLATGNLPPSSFHFQTGLMIGEPNYIDNVWNPPKGHLFPERVQELSPDAEIVVIGTGLTTVDVILTLRARGYKGVITCISRNGWLPLPHAEANPYPAWEWVLAPQFAPRSAAALLTRLREEVRRAAAQGHDWRDVVDSLRPVTQALWKQLPTAEKRRFMRRLFTLWNVHRHRMAPEIHAGLKAMQQSGALKVTSGKIYYVGSDRDGLTVAYRKRGANRIETLRPALVINCTGPEYDIASSDHALLRNLRDRELITVGPLRVGIEVTELGTAKGKAAEAVFPVGPLLVGESLESTAVPELREQAQHAALQVIHRLRALHETDHQARMAMGEWI